MSFLFVFPILSQHSEIKIALDVLRTNEIKASLMPPEFKRPEDWFFKKRSFDEVDHLEIYKPGQIIKNFDFELFSIKKINESDQLGRIKADPVIFTGHGLKASVFASSCFIYDNTSNDKPLLFWLSFEKTEILPGTDGLEIIF